MFSLYPGSIREFFLLATVPPVGNDPDECTIAKQNDGTFKGNVKFDDYRSVDFFLEMKENGHFTGVGSAFTLIYKTPPEHIFLHVPGSGSYHDLDVEFCKPK
jgi:hypothetical protein